MEVKATVYEAKATVKVAGHSEDDALQLLIAALDAEKRKVHERLRSNERSRNAIAP